MNYPRLDHNCKEHLYIQLSNALKSAIIDGAISSGERLPSLRRMASGCGISLTTAKMAYEELVAEGFIINRPQSGFFVPESVSSLISSSGGSTLANDSRSGDDSTSGGVERSAGFPQIVDPETFAFGKWKKCMTEVLSETPHLLLTESDRQGEDALRKEIAAYLYQTRGVVCTDRQVVISAGTQQLVNHLARLLKLMHIELICTEEPGYNPAKNTFRDWGFGISSIPVQEDGIQIEKLPTNIRTVAYVCPQNQFPTGASMPVHRKEMLIEWARENDSLIIEDDFNNELRYPGLPVPSLQSLDDGERTVYISSFNPTLFPAVKISYMVLPPEMSKLFDRIKENYDQTSSKTEQLTLARFMKEGYFQSNLRRVRKLYSAKLQAALKAIARSDPNENFVSVENTQSGINIFLKIDTHAVTLSEGRSGSMRTDEIYQEMTERMLQAAAALGIRARGIGQLNAEGKIYLILYYNQITLEQIHPLFTSVISDFKSVLMKGGLNMPSVYEVIRLDGGRPQFLQEHYQRLENSLGSLGMTVPFTFDRLSGSIAAMAEEGQILNHNIKLEVDVSGHSILYLNPTHYPSKEQYKNGVKTDLFMGERKNPHIKMMDQSLRDATDEAIRRGGLYEVILVDQAGNITEGSRSNVFFIKKREVYTSPLHQVLPGVTRGRIIDIISSRGIRIHEKAIPASDISTFDAAFISGTSPKVLPISSVGNVPFDVDNALLRNIMTWYDEATEAPDRPAR